MKAITLKRPWANLIEMGAKTIETRTHNRFRGLVGQRIAIHAGKGWDEYAIRQANEYINIQDWQVRGRAGQILCTVEVWGFEQLGEWHSKAALCDCSSGNLYGLFLRNIEYVTDLTVIKGRLGAWDWEPTDE
jgi:hypothetical protein